MATLADIRADIIALDAPSTLEAVLNRGVHALGAYRLAHRAWQAGLPLLPQALTRLIQILYSIDIDWRAQIGPGVVVRHGAGTVIGEGVVVGSGTVIFHNVTLGVIGDDLRLGYPVVGEDVLLGAGCAVLGGISIGRGAKVGANATVLRDVPGGATVVGNPGRIINGYRQ